MIPLRALREAVVIRRCVSTVADHPVSISEIVDSDSAPSSSSTSPASLSKSTGSTETAVPRDKAVHVQDLYKFDKSLLRLPYGIRSHVTPLPASESSKIDQYLNTDRISKALGEIDALLANHPERVTEIKNVDSVFIKAQRLLRLSEVPSDNRQKEKETLSTMVHQMRRLYTALKLQGLLKDIHVESMAKILIQNHSANTAFQLLSEYPRRDANINLVNLTIKLTGDAIPETWTFPTDRRLYFGLSLPIPSIYITTPSNLMEYLKNSGHQMNLTTMNTFVLAVGKSRNLNLLDSLINSTWNLETGEPLSSHSVLYPDQTTLTSMVYSYAYNGQLPKGLEVLNQFISKYEIELGDKFWYDIYNVLFVAMPKDTFKLELFQSLWDLMKSFNRRPSLRLFHIKLKILQQFYQLQEMQATLPELYRMYKVQDPVHTQRLMYKYMNSILKLQAHKHLYNQSHKMVETWSPNDAYRQVMRNRIRHFYAYYYNHIDKQMAAKSLDNIRFDDDDDDDFKLW